MELRHLRYFVAVAEEKSITVAAERRLHTAQPSLSRRADIIKGLKRQNLLAAEGKLVVPTPAGLQLFGLLKGAAPALVDPGMTAVWEMRLDEVVTGRVHFKGVIDEIAAEAGKLIDVLRGHRGALVDLSRPAPTAARRGRGRAALHQLRLLSGVELPRRQRADRACS